MSSDTVRIGRAGVLILVLIGAFASGLVLNPGRAAATPALLALDTSTPELKAAETTGGSMVELSFINLTDGPAHLEVEEVGQPKCDPKVKPSQLKPNLITAVTVEFRSTECTTGEGLELEVNATLFGGGSQKFEIKPTGTPATPPNWHELWAFLVSLTIGLGLVGCVLGRWRESGPLRPPGQGYRKAVWASLSQPLLSLEATWNFNDNWATNATAAGALLTGLFSATTAKTFLGENAESLTALATVGAAIALVFVGAAPIIALATKSYAPSEHKPGSSDHKPADSDDKRGDSFTVGGVLAAATLVIAGAVGQLWVVAYTASRLRLGHFGWLVWVAFGLALVLLLVYCWRTLDDVLRRGTAAAAQDPAKEGIEAAKLIAKAIEAAASEDRKAGAFAAVNQQLDAKTTGSRAYRRRTRSALI